MKYARVDDQSKVIEIFVEPEGFTINECFVPIIVQQFIAVSDEVNYGWIKQEDGTFVEFIPEPEETAVPPDEEVIVDG